MTNRELLREIYKAVSYTHLDVYKRQPFWFLFFCSIGLENLRKIN